MKKTLALVLSVILTISMLCCGAFAEAANIVGDWYGELGGLIAVLSVNADGTYVFDFGGEVEDGTYEFDGAIFYADKGTEEETQIPYDAERDVLILDEGDGFYMEFSREEITAFEPAAALTDSKIEDFAGTWKTTMVDVAGYCVSAEFAGVDFDVTVDGYGMTFVSEALGVTDTMMRTGVLENGVLAVAVENDMGSMELSLQMLEDGMMAAVLDITDVMTMTFYMDRAA